MPIEDEEALRQLLLRSTSDLHAPAELGAEIATRHRRRATRHRALGIAATGVAAGTAFGVIASGAAGPSHRPAGAGPAIRLTAAQVTLNHLSAEAADSSAPPAGRYVVLTEKQDGGVDRTSVIDSQTGDVWTFQQGPGVPAELPVARHDSPTLAQYNAIPTSPAALRAYLIQQFRQEQQLVADQVKQQMAAAKKAGKPLAGKAVISQPKLSEDDIVFDQATNMLWSPLAGPDLRAALFKLLEATPGVVVNSSATDLDQRRAIEISRVDGLGETIAAFEDPASSAVLETSFAGPTGNGYDLYLSVTSTNAAPTVSPYGS